MHKSVILLAALAASAFVAEPASAKTFSIKFVGQAAVASACKAAHGNFYNQSGGTYGCAGGGGRSVECNSNTKTCQGTIPRSMPGSQDVTVVLGVFAPAKPSKPGGVLGTGILEGGMVLGSQGPAATGSPAGGRPAAAPSAPPVIIR
jgi:hypothetical protein